MDPLTSLKVHKFTWNPVRENAYVIYDSTGECLIVDPGCYEQAEKDELSEFISSHHLLPVKLLNTHCHFDHVLGNRFVAERYGLAPFIHKLELQVLDSIPAYAPSYGFNYELSPAPGGFLDERDQISIGRSKLKVLFTPGHSPGSLSFLSPEGGFVLGGDVLFYENIGRTDLPGCDLNVLSASIREKLYTLPDETLVHAGHGWETTIGHEKRNNPYVRP